MTNTLASTISKGEKLFQEGKVEDATTFFLSLLESNPNHPEVLNNLGVIAFSSEQLEEAEKYLLSAIRFDGRYRDAYENLARLYTFNGDLQRAASVLESYPFSAPDDCAVCNQLGSIFLSLKQNEKAKTYFQRSLALNPGQREVKVVLEEMLLLEGKQPKSIPVVKKTKKTTGNTGMNRTVAVTAQLHLCLNCGACAVACPQSAIRLVETPDGRLVPQIDERACVLCGHCLQICPGMAIADLEDFLSRHQPFQGPCLRAFVGRASDPVIYRKAQSGGLVTAIAEQLLKAHRVDGVVVSRLEWGGGRAKGRGFVARSREELLAAQGSKYCPIPLLEALSPKVRPPGKFAFVGLPCHMHALRNLRRWKPELVKDIEFTIGLFCDRILSYAAMDYLLRRANVTSSKVKQFLFRDKERTGYPGDVVILDENDVSKTLPSEERMRIKDLFTPLRCRLCFDKLNVFSDIAVGDPHGIQGVDHQGGESVCVIRTEKGQEAMNLCRRSQAVIGRSIDYRSVLAGQGLNGKIAAWHGFSTAWQRMGVPFPGYIDQVLPFFHCSSSENQGNASVLVQSLQQERCTSREELIVDAGIRMGEHEPYFGRLSESHFIVEVMGCGFVNKGAMLMMVAIIRQLNRHRPDAKIASAPMPWMMRFLDYGILPLVPGYLDYPDIDIVLDASGFLYSDQWGAAPAKAAARKFQRLKAFGATIILLPQAFGPFGNSAIRDSFKRIADSAELIFARDEVSLEHVRSVLGDSPKVSLAPDFTVLLDGTPPGEIDWYAGRLCVVPNARMLDKTSGKEGSQYLEFIQRVVVTTRRLGREAFFLIHEGHADYEIARAVNRLLGRACKIVYEQDPLVLKGILGASAVVVSSRYHALIGSLSQAVPSLCVGWSHKYRELFKSYEFTEGLLGLDATEDDLQRTMLPLLDGESRLRVVARLRSATERQKQMAGAMWRSVFECIEERQGKLHASG